MKAGHRLQQEHRDKSSLFSPSEFAESANWICCLLFCFRWAVVFPWKMPVFHLQVWTSLSPDYYHWFWSSHSTVGQPCLVIFVLLHDCSAYCCAPHWCTSGSEWPVSMSRAVPVLRKHLLSCWKTTGSCCRAVQAAQNRSHNQLSLICFISCFMHILVLVGWVSTTW